jgi:hypothetical protein
MKEIPDEDQDAATDGHVQGFSTPSGRYADRLEEASVVVESARENQPEGVSDRTEFFNNIDPKLTLECALILLAELIHDLAC